MRIPGSCVVVAALGDGLMVSSPSGASDGLFGVAEPGPDDRDQKTADFRLSQRDHVTLAPFCFGSVVAARIALSIASANIDSVT